VEGGVLAEGLEKTETPRTRRSQRGIALQGIDARS
jgi:hypothetical protein